MRYDHYPTAPTTVCREPGSDPEFEGPELPVGLHREGDGVFVAYPAWTIDQSSGRLDHIFLRGLASPDTAAAGTVLVVGSASDHLPVWTIALLR
ncbi:MAG TPA: hypothetical protein VGN76_15575 [Gemmatimonadales bacterium]|nr:hypothetical protein [Gemmatimonadales bacterium]